MLSMPSWTWDFLRLSGNLRRWQYPGLEKSSNFRTVRSRRKFFHVKDLDQSIECLQKCPSVGMIFFENEG
jgi:hypothetical protein